MARIEETEEGVTTDIIAPKIVIDWNPILNDGPVFFHMERMVRGPEGQLLSMTHEAIMPKKISDILQRTITLNIGGNDVEFQGALLMGLIKQVF